MVRSYVFPGDTKALFAWTIKPIMTPMVLASAYLGGVYFFLANDTFVSRPPSPRRSGLDVKRSVRRGT